jgi:C-terminal processing protease CtpA/Prc
MSQALEQPPASFLAAAAEPVREHLAASMRLADFLAEAGTLTLDERLLLVEQALVLIEQNYVHLPLKVAMHAVNPVQRLRLLRGRLSRQSPETMDAEWRFHAELSEIFHSLCDPHTNYLLPQPYSGKIAYLPFLVEEYFDHAASHYIVTHLVQGFSVRDFGPGTEITHWNGIPIDRAVDLNAARFTGSNPAARHARGLSTLTVRPLRIHLAPDEHWVRVTYTGADGSAHELQQPWLVVDNLPPMTTETHTPSRNAASQGLDISADDVGRARQLLFAPRVVAAQRTLAATGLAPAAAADGDVATTLPGVFQARSVATPSGTFGHIRIFTFSTDDPGAFVAEFVRLIEALPRNGLIVDVRGNIRASETSLQTLTPRQIQPEPMQFITSPLNVLICRRHEDNPLGIDTGPWFPSMDQAVETGTMFSNAYPLTPVGEANAIGQRYYGPVVLITDASCYSATDIFAAGFADHGIGTVLGVDDNTGAGGANVWTHEVLEQLMDQPEPDATSPYRDLPRGAGMRVAMRRTLRVGALSGTQLEDLGVTPTVRHRMTRADVLDANRDLLDHAGVLLAAQPVRELAVERVDGADGSLRLDLRVAGLDRADVLVDGRPRASIDLSGATATVTLPGAAAAAAVRVEGYAAGSLVAVRSLRAAGA